jgi:hypothetical protein
MMFDILDGSFEPPGKLKLDLNIFSNLSDFLYIFQNKMAENLLFYPSVHKKNIQNNQFI